MPHVIGLHPEQVRHIARQACGMPSATAEKIADLERRISVLTNKLQGIVCDEVMRSELIKRCGYDLQYLAQFDGLLDLALEFDGGRLEAEV